MRTIPSLMLAAGLLTTGCMSLEYDLAAVPVPISAQPVPAGTPVEPIRIEAKHVLYAHGLLGEREPDVAWLVGQASAGYGSVADCRITHAADFHDWLLTHLSLTLLRFKTITIEMDRIR